MNKEVLKEKLNKEMRRSGTLKKIFYSTSKFESVHKSLKDFFKENYSSPKQETNEIEGKNF